MPNIRRFINGDEITLWQLKCDTIRKVNIKDYSEQQVQAWAPEIYDQIQWAKRIQDMNPFVAEIDGGIVGYADVQKDGYIDHFFCHIDYQGQRIGKALMKALFEESKLKNISRLYSHVSITAKPFFEYFGFIVIKQQSVEVRGQLLTNFVMAKNIKN